MKKLMYKPAKQVFEVTLRVTAEYGDVDREGLQNHVRAVMGSRSPIGVVSHCVARRRSDLERLDVRYFYLRENAGKVFKGDPFACVAYQPWKDADGVGVFYGLAICSKEDMKGRWFEHLIPNASRRLERMPVYLGMEGPVKPYMDRILEDLISSEFQDRHPGEGGRRVVKAAGEMILRLMLERGKRSY